MIVRAVAMVALLLVAPPALFAQGDPWFRQSSKPKDFAAAQLPWNNFSIDIPKNWVMAPGFGGVLLSTVERGKANQTLASISLEQTRLVVPLTATDVDASLAELEGNLANTRDPSGSKFAHEVKEAGDRRFVFITYTRPGLNGPDSVVLYVFPSGNIMYRLICIAPGAEVLPKYQTAFAHVAASFKTTGASSN